MTFVITNECNTCAACANVCFMDAIIPGKTIYSIDPEKCNDCSACEDACAREAIVRGEPKSK